MARSLDSDLIRKEKFSESVMDAWSKDQSSVVPAITYNCIVSNLVLSVLNLHLGPKFF